MSDNRDETTSPFAEPFPLADSDRVAAIQRRDDERAGSMLELRNALEFARDYVPREAPDQRQFHARCERLIGRSRVAILLDVGGPAEGGG